MLSITGEHFLDKNASVVGTTGVDFFQSIEDAQMWYICTMLFTTISCSCNLHFSSQLFDFNVIHLPVFLTSLNNTQKLNLFCGHSVKTEVINSCY